MAMLKISGKRFFELRRNAERLHKSYREFISKINKLYDRDYIVQTDKGNMVIDDNCPICFKEMEQIIHQYILGTKDTMSHYKNYYYEEVEEVTIDHEEFEYLIDELTKYENKVFSIKAIESIESKINFALNELKEYFESL